MRRVILRLRLVRTRGLCFVLECLLTRVTDDVRDIYRRAEKQELEVKGLREGESLATE